MDGGGDKMDSMDEEDGILQFSGFEPRVSPRVPEGEGGGGGLAL
jgi:hypothetical protein